jgi:hypothetical protein
MTITFRELRRRLSESTSEPVDIYDLFEEWFNLFEDSTFYIYKVSTGAVLATNIQGFEAAKAKASQLRKSLGLKFDDIRFKSERSRAAGTLGVSGSGKNFTNSRGEKYPIQYSRNYNPSKRSRFSGYYDKDGNWHDLS